MPQGVCNDMIYKVDLDALLPVPTDVVDYQEAEDLTDVTFTINGTVVDWKTINSCFTKRSKTNVDISISFTGKRNVTDPVQIAVAATAFKTGAECETTLEITDNATAISIIVPVVLNVTQYAGGAGDDVSNFAFDAGLNGEPLIA